MCLCRSKEDPTLVFFRPGVTDYTPLFRKKPLSLLDRENTPVPPPFVKWESVGRQNTHKGGLPPRARFLKTPPFLGGPKNPRMYCARFCKTQKGVSTAPRRWFYLCPAPGKLPRDRYSPFSHTSREAPQTRFLWGAPWMKKIPRAPTLVKKGARMAPPKTTGLRSSAGQDFKSPLSGPLWGSKNPPEPRFWTVVQNHQRVPMRTLCKCEPPAGRAP